MEMFGATNLIIQYVDNIVKFGVDLAERWVVNVLEMFLGFVIKYLDVYHYLGSLEVKIAVFKLINNYIANLPNSIDKYTNNNSNNRKIIE